MALAQNGMAMHGAAWFALEQTAGKGQRGKTWKTEPGQNIILSVLLDTSRLAVSAQFRLSMAVALAVHDFYSKYALDDTRIKWPNDIYWRDRKAGGILIENVLKGNIWQWAVAGMGININQVVFDAAIKNPVSLKQITGKNFDTPALAQELCSFLEQRFQQLHENDTDALLQAYNERLFKRGEKVKLHKDAIAFECIIDHVDEMGRLWLRDSIYPYVEFGEVRWDLAS
ncbi:biotin--[acetyl-CoA-carboxylase] ligase [Deminuibacter soli]|uniref:Biotin--[acetyl-CoA-carboxylase] ligase n=2 Tax=Deminuibacter soli TaxID=2291815 RepID=A0A3E1NRX4_9BACT|nr:biotin--[acetyl-CoA-carboxylase] ligase [Deminuibacter soli]